MSQDEIRQGAENFIKDQLAIMGEYGSAPSLSPDEYRTLVEDAARNLGFVAAAHPS